MITTEEKAYKEIKKLAEDFEAGKKHYLSKEYQEAETRKDFIDKFFVALGWDVHHDEQNNPYEQEVKVERGVNISGTQKRADYSFALAPNFRDPKFFVEAKKPSQSLSDEDYYFQTIRYGWHKATPFAVLTNFVEFHILDCRFSPNISTILKRLIKQFYFTDYADKEKFAEIYWLFSHEAVSNNSLGKRVEELPKPRGKTDKKTVITLEKYLTIDDAFLEEIHEIRKKLATAFKKNDARLNSEELTEATHRTIDRLVFIRFLEDKLIEPEPYVYSFGEKGTAWNDFINLCKKLDAKYNGIVFKNIFIDDDKFKGPVNSEFHNICQNICHLHSRFLYNEIPIHILGSIYERFLGNVVYATDKRVTVKEKPEVKKAGGVYYTPKYIVDYIVRNTIGKLIEEKTPEQISKMRFADIACGSGSFLIGVFDCLLDYHNKYYQFHPDQAKNDGCHYKDGIWILSIKQKQNILLNNIYGVDIDMQAVEVTQLSLSIKTLEDETTATANEMQVLFHEKILPDMTKNIKCGNSLIGTDILTQELFDTEEEKKLNPMDFDGAFPEVMRNGGFDAIVGNPPYVNLEVIDNNLKIYLKIHSSIFAGKGDILYFFFESGIKLLKNDGKLGFITSRYYLEATYASQLRKYITNNCSVLEIFDFANFSVFQGVGIHTVITLLLKNNYKQKTKVKRLLNSDGNNINLHNISLYETDIQNDEWLLANVKEKSIMEHVGDKGIKLSEIAIIEQGQKSGLNSVFVIDEEKYKKFEKLPLKKVIKNSHISRYYIDFQNIYLIYADDFFNIEKFPKIKTYLLNFKMELMKRAEAKDNLYNWYRLQRPRNQSLFESKEKIVVPYRAESNRFGYDDKQYYNDGGDIRIIVLNSDNNYSTKYCLGILNSKLMVFYYKFIGRRKGKIYEYFVESLSKIPIPIINFQNQTEKAKHDKMVQLVDQMLQSKNELQTAKTDKDITYYERKCTELDTQIDNLVYELYGLLEEEIKIVEANI